MAVIILFACFQILASAFAGWRGGTPERLASITLLAAFAISVSLPFYFPQQYRHVAVALFSVDVALLVVLVLLATVADRFWPLWMASLQLVTVASHGVRAYDPAIIPWAYWLVVMKIGWPIVMVLIAATIRHRQRRAAGLPEYAWTFERRADERAAHQRTDRA